MRTEDRARDQLRSIAHVLEDHGYRKRAAFLRNLADPPVEDREFRVNEWEAQDA